MSARAPGFSASVPSKVWVTTTYFAEGLPYMLVCFLFGAFLTDVGAPEAWIGYANYLSVPWTLKFFWAPAVDLYGTKRRWLLVTEGLLVAGFSLLSVLVPAASAAKMDPATQAALPGMVALLFALAVVAATHDISIDGFYMEIIADPSEQAAYTGLRSAAFQIAKIFVRSALLATAAWIGWRWGFGFGAVALGASWLFHVAVLPRTEVLREKRAALAVVFQGFLAAFRSWLAQPHMLLIAALLVTYKLGDQLMFAMNTAFMLREVGVTKSDMAWIGIIGTAGLTAGSLLSAWCIQRFSWERAVWPLTLGMNLNIWLYVWLAWSVAHAHQAGVAGPSLPLVAAVYTFEQFAGGLGASVLVVFALRTCLAEFKAAHFAVATAISSLGSWLLGGKAGEIVAHIGYTNLYLLSFAAAIPSMILLAIFLRVAKPQAQAS